MPFIINLSTFYDNSRVKQIKAVHQLYCQNKASDTERDVGFFASTVNRLSSVYTYLHDVFSLMNQIRIGREDYAQLIQGVIQQIPFDLDMSNEERITQVKTAWNAGISIDETQLKKLSDLLNWAEKLKLPIYLIGNTDPLHFQKILADWQAYFTDLPFTDIDFDFLEKDKPIQILPDVYICLSFQYGMTSRQFLAEQPLCQPGFTGEREPFILVSPEAGDIDEAERLGYDTIYHPLEQLHSIECESEDASVMSI